MAGVMVIMLYLTVLTIFLPFVVFEAVRVHKKKRECCGVCCCKEDSVLFCKGRYLTPVQKRYSEIEIIKPPTKTSIE